MSWSDSEAATSFIAHSGYDDTILAKQSQRMVAALTGSGMEVVYVVIPRVGHSGIGQWSLTNSLSVPFLAMHLHPER